MYNSKYFLPVLSVAWSFIGEEKLNISFPFQGFQNSKQVGRHFSLFISTKILIKQFKKSHQYNIFWIFENPCSANCHYIENFVALAKRHAGENGNLANNQLCLALSWTVRIGIAVSQVCITGVHLWSHALHLFSGQIY